MSAKQLSSLLLCCGALHDIAENCKDKKVEPMFIRDRYTYNDVARQVTEIQLKIEKIVVKKIK